MEKKTNIYTRKIVNTFLKFFMNAFVITGFYPVSGQQFVFHKLLPDNGSNFNFVTGITQDPTGYMWFSTKKGLYKYDGVEITSYKNNPLDPKSIISNSLESIYADNTGIIWIGSLGNGLDRFDPMTGIFTHYQYDPKDINSISNDTITTILQDHKGNIWIGTHGGLNRYDSQNNSFIKFLNEPDNPNSLSDNQIRVLYEDSNNNLWIGAGSPYADNGGSPESGGLTRLNPEDGTFTRFMHEPLNSNSLISNKISAIHEDREGILWIGTNKNGLHRLNSSTGNIERLPYDPGHPEKLNSPPVKQPSQPYEHITFINQDIKGNMWYGTVESGLFCYILDSAKVINFNASENTGSGFSDTGAWTGFSSSDGIFWIGSTLGNIYFIDPLHVNIPHFNINGRPASAFLKEPNGSLWVGTDQGVFRYSHDNSSTHYTKLNIIPSEKASENIFSIKTDSKDNIWIGTEDGLYLWNKKSENFTTFKNDPNNNRSLSDNSVLTVYEDRKKNFWVGTFNGLNLLDPETGLSTHYYPNYSNLNSRNIITSVTEDYTGKLWVGVWDGGGVYEFNPENGKFNNVLSGSNVLCLYEDSDQILWAGSTEGLFRYDRNKKIFIHFGSYNQLINVPDVQGIVEDNQKNLWVSTSSGIVRINPLRNETSTYGRKYGVGENSFVFLSYYKDRDGKIYFGDSNGYFAFMPEEINRELNAPEIVFTGFHLADQLSNSANNSPLINHLSDSDEIQLSHNQNVFVFDFIEIDYADPKQNRMFYFLENYDNNWQLANSERRAYYFNVPPGMYNFRVKAVNSYGVWAEKNIPLLIKSPWWQKWWAYVMYVLVFAAGIFGWDKIQRQRLLEKEHRIAKEKELAHAKEIEKAFRNLEMAHENLKTTQAQLIQSEKMASLGELTAGIAHEIQNPLNFVNNFSEVNSELLVELKEEIKKGNIGEVNAITENLIINEGKINLHGKRAESIVKGMLLHSRGSSGKKEPTDINNLADECLRLAYHGFKAKDKSFNANFKLITDDTLPKIDVVPQDTGRVLLNMINNAFYAVDKKAKENRNGYQPMVIVQITSCNLHSERPVVRIVIEDNGCGIPEHVKSKIFQPFYTTKPSGQGTGLGLSMSYDIVRAHDGDITFKSNENIGTEFIIEIPVSQKSLSNKYMYQVLDK